MSCHRGIAGRRLLHHFYECDSEDFAQEHSGYPLLEHLDAGVDAVLVEYDIIRSVWENFEAVVKGSPFGIDNHFSRRLVEIAL